MSTSTAERAIVIIANVIGFIYNVPQVVLTVRTKSATDLSFIFLSLRLVSAVLWIIYTTLNWSPDVFISWVITGTSSGILFYYKLRYSEKSVWDEVRICRRSNTAVELKETTEEENHV